MVPKVSVCVPTYNRASALCQTIAAILNQTFSDWELIVCDDASNDNTGEVVTAFKDKRIHYYRNETNLGLYANWNRGIALANAEYIAIYHDHDLYLPTILEHSVAALGKFPNSSFVHTALLLIDEKNAPVGVDIRPFSPVTPGVQLARLLAESWSSPIMAATAMVRRRAYAQVGHYQYDKYGLACDMDMWFRLCSVGDVAYIPIPQALIRARARGQGTAEFRWSNVVGSIHMRQDHLRQAFGTDFPRYLFSKIKYVLQRDVLLTTLGIRTILLEPTHVVDEGAAVINREASAWVRLAFQITRHNEVAQSLLRKYMLPVHYRRTAKLLESQRLAATVYLDANPLEWNRQQYQ